IAAWARVSASPRRRNDAQQGELYMAETIATTRASGAAAQDAKHPHILAHSRKDNVAVVVVEGLTAGTDAFGVVTEDNSTFSILVKQDIPLGHKIALGDARIDDTAIKYGQDVGRFVR